MIFTKINLPLNPAVENLLLEADPELQAIQKYINNCDIFTLSNNAETVAVICAEPQDANIEIKNIAVAAQYRRAGLATNLIERIAVYYSQKGYKSMTVGTAAEVPYILIFYRKCGFKEYKIIKNFFIDNYSQPIYDNEILCKDMAVLKRNI